MKEFIRSQWTKAMRSLAAAEATLDTDPDSAASRAYYAAFHGVTATLAGRGMEFTKHTAVRAALASATKAIEKARTILTALQPLLPDGAV
ncbi:MAG: HEPN domain-containing protein [Planctomycetes bacterium]|nr:HEPN domain-containing protein [Planctomycetota bacterium]